MTVLPDQIEQVLTGLTQTPCRITSASAGLEHARLHFKPDADAWSANDILAHLRACADVWGKSLMKMIAQDHPTIRYVSPRTWIKKTDYPTQDFHQSLHAFAQQRAELLKTLSTLDTPGWSLGATFSATTRGREQTVLSYAQRMADHEREQCEQLEAMLK